MTVDQEILATDLSDPVLDSAYAEPFLEKSEYEDALRTVQKAAATYYNDLEVGEENYLLVDDAAYDALVARMIATEEKNPSWTSSSSPSQAVAAGVAGGDVEHAVKMLSLDNVFNDEELLAWMKRLEKILERSVSSYTVEPKLDGCALSLTYEKGLLVRAATRGSGSSGEDVTKQVRIVAGIPHKLTENLDVEVRGEVFMSDEDFKEANEIRLSHGEQPFANPRNGASGSLRAWNRTYDVPLSFLAYGAYGLEKDGKEMKHSETMQKVAELGVKTTGQSKAGMPVCKTSKEVVEAVAAFGKNRATLGFPVDGSVIKADDPKDRSDAGFSSKAPRWGIAFKFPPDTRVTTLLDIELQVGRTGIITPRAVLEPVNVGGTKITFATLHNASEVSRKDIRVGDKVWVRRAGEVIPEVVAVKLDERQEGSTAWVPPVSCPRCKGTIDKSQKRWRCINRTCGTPEALHYFASRDAMDIDGLGDVIVSTLVGNGKISDVADIFFLKKEDISTLEKQGETSAKNLLAAIEKCKQQPLSRLFTGLGVRLTGRSMSRRLARHFGTLEALRSASVEDMKVVEGVGPERAEMIVAELKELSPVIDKLISAGVATKEPGSPALVDSSSSVTASNLPLQKDAPLSVLISGKVPGFSRTEAQEVVETLGGKPSSSVSKNTDLVILGEGGKEEKATKAQSFGASVISGEDFAALVARYNLDPTSVTTESFIGSKA